MKNEWRLSVAEVEGDRAASFWIKAALRDALRRDVLDAARDARRLAEILEARCDEALR